VGDDPDLLYYPLRPGFVYRPPEARIDASTEPEEVRKRGGVTGCIVNAVPIRSPVLDEGRFRADVLEALKGGEAPDDLPR